MTSRLTWTDGHPTFTGSAGAIQLFRCTWDPRKSHPGRPWVMSCSLPGYEDRRWRGQDPADLREQAVTAWAEWLARAGVIARPRLTDGHPHEAGLHPGWLGHDGHRPHRHETATGRTEWEKP